MKGKVVCHISFNHSAFDDRIYWKELIALKDAGYRAIHIAVADEPKVFLSDEGVQIILIKRQTKHKNVYINRLSQLFFTKQTTMEAIFIAAVKLKADVYHYHDLQVNAIAKRLRQLPQKPAVIYDSHESYHLLPNHFSNGRFLSKLFDAVLEKLISTWEVKMASNCCFIIATDEYTQKYFSKRLPVVPCSIIYNYSFFSPNSEIKINKAKFDFIYSGQISKKRGIKEIIYAIDFCRRKIPKVSLLLIGEFDNSRFEVEIKKLIGDLDLHQNVKLEKAVSFRMINQYYEVSKVGMCLLYNTQKFTTAIPIKIFEYMSFGLPIICSEHGVTTEIIKENDCGIPVDHKDVAKIGNAMLELISNDNQYERLSLNGLKAVKEKYSWEHEKEKLLNVYRSLIKE